MTDFTLFAAVTLAVLSVVLFATAQRWVWWAPGLLLLGLVNTVLSTFRQGGQVPKGFSAAMLVFYVVGIFTLRRLAPRKLTMLERIALVVYMICMFLPAAFWSPGAMPPLAVLVAPLVVGMIALVIAFKFGRIPPVPSSE